MRTDDTEGYVLRVGIDERMTRTMESFSRAKGVEHLKLGVDYKGEMHCKM